MKVKEYRTILNELREPVLEETINHFADGRLRFDNPKVIRDFLESNIKMHVLADEYCYCLCLDTKCKLQGVFEVGHGAMDSSPLPVREIFQKALLLNAKSIVIAHNHPSGDPTPSLIDSKVTERIREAGKVLGVELVDHIIVGNGAYYSYRENFF